MKKISLAILLALPSLHVNASTATPNQLNFNAAFVAFTGGSLTPKDAASKVIQSSMASTQASNIARELNTNEGFAVGGFISKTNKTSMTGKAHGLTDKDVQNALANAANGVISNPTTTPVASAPTSSTSTAPVVSTPTNTPAVATPLQQAVLDLQQQINNSTSLINQNIVSGAPQYATVPTYSLAQIVAA